MDESKTTDYDPHALRVLEYAQVLELLAERTACALGRERALELTPSPIVAFVRERLQETTEACKVSDAHGPFPLGGVHDIRPALHKAEISLLLTPHELLDIAGTVIGASRLKTFLIRHAEKGPLLADRAAGIDEFPQLLSEIELCIGRSGDVLDSASPALASVRSKMRVAAKRIDERLSAILSSSTTRSMLMEAQIVLRDDRRCLPVKAEFKRAIPGIVHDQSTSGATLFIEPMAVVELNNELRQHEAAERAEIDRILGKLTNSVQRLVPRLQSTVSVVAGLDLANAKAKLAYDLRCVEPVMNQKAFVRLRDARHPLLNQDTVVPVSVSLGDPYKALLITGPNTGGKTVTLKTVGLLTLMAQSGLHIPAGDGSELAHFDQIFADIGDEQSIAQSLSTFSAHVTNIVRILRSCGRRALVLLDELGAGTDPAEGAALAKAILTYLLDHNARIIATTHYGELKEYAFAVDGIENAAVEFDTETLRPTYRLMQGVPGSSNAFHIARRLGMPNRVVDLAIESLSKAGADAAEIMVRLETAKRQADDERRKAERLRKEMDQLKLKYEERLRNLEALRSEAKERASEEARQVIRQKTEKMDNIISELRRIGKEGRKTQSARKKMKETSDELIGGIGYEREPLPVDEAEVPKTLKKGEKVRVTSLGGATGEVLADASMNEAIVQVGAMRVTVPLTGLRKIGELATVAVAAPPRSNVAAIAMSKATTIDPELKLIGLRVDAALPRLDKWLDDVCAVGLESVRIVHGKGTGQLRKAVWDHLKADPRILSFAMAHPDAGGAGATVVRFRE